MTGHDFCEVTCMDVTPLQERRVFDLWMDRMPPLRRRKITSLRNAESQRLSLGVGLLLHVALGERGIRATETEYAEDTLGKPYLPQHPELCFSLSHSGVWALCAISDRVVGCDVEKIGRADQRIVDRCFHPEERERMKSIRDPYEWQAEFTRIWTRKEAYLKASGKGLSESMSGFSALRDGPEVHYAEQDMAKGYRFSLCTFGRKPPRIKWDEVRLC